LASTPAFGEEQLRQDSKFDVRPLQSRSPIRVVRPQSDPSRPSECETTQNTNAIGGRRNQCSRRQSQHSSERWLFWRIDRPETERVVRLEMGRHRLLPRNDERHAIHRLRCCWSVQDRIITEAHTRPSARCRCTSGMAKAINLHGAGRLGFREQTAPRAASILGTGNFAKICSTSCRKGRNPEMHRLPHVSSYVFDAAAKCGH